MGDTLSSEAKQKRYVFYGNRMLQDLVTYQYPEPDEPNPHLHTAFFLNIRFNIITVLPGGFFPSSLKTYLFVYNSNFFHVFCVLS